VEFSVPFRPAHSAFCTMDTGSFLEVKQPEPDVDHRWLAAVSIPPLCTCDVTLWDDLHLLTFGKFWSIRSLSTAADSSHAFVSSSRLLPFDGLPFTSPSD